MVSVTLATIISCSQAYKIINRLTSVVGLNEVQKKEIIQEIREMIPSCPITIKKDEPIKKQSNRSDD